jgi:hypothetical protein
MILKIGIEAVGSEQRPVASSSCKHGSGRSGSMNIEFRNKMGNYQLRQGPI